MCRLADSFFGLLTLRQGTLLIGWIMLPLSVSILVLEVMDPELHKMFSRDAGEPFSVIPWVFVLWTLADINGYICLLIGVYQERPNLLVGWICVISLGILGTVLDVFRTVKAIQSADDLYARIASTSVVIEIWLYMIMVVYNFYLDLRGISQGEPFNVVPWMFALWSLIDINAYICLLVGIYQMRPTLLVGWICVISVGIVATVLDAFRSVKGVHTADGVYPRIASTSVVIEIWLYMILIVYNFYLDLKGISRGASLINLARPQI